MPTVRIGWWIWGLKGEGVDRPAQHDPERLGDKCRSGGPLTYRHCQTRLSAVFTGPTGEDLRYRWMILEGRVSLPLSLSEVVAKYPGQWAIGAPKESTCVLVTAPLE